MSLGTLALIGGGEWTEECRDLERELLARGKDDEVVLLPTAAAYQRPERQVELARAALGVLGATVTPLMVLSRGDADREEYAATVRAAGFVYLSGGSAMHLRSVMKDSLVWEAIVTAWHDGAVVAATSDAAMVVCDPMVDPRGGAFTLGLGLVEQLAVVPHFDTWSDEKAHRTVQLAPAGVPLTGVDERTALIREPGGAWRASGAGRVRVFVDGSEASLAALPG